MISLNAKVVFKLDGKDTDGVVVGLINDSRFGRSIMVKANGYYHYVLSTKVKVLPE